MKKILQNLTISFLVGIVLFLIGIAGSILLLPSGYGAIFGIYFLFLSVFSFIIIVIDRICTRKYGVGKVNKIALYILAGLFAIALLNTISGNAIVRFIIN